MVPNLREATQRSFGIIMVHEVYHVKMLIIKTLTLQRDDKTRLQVLGALVLYVQFH